MGTNSRGGSSAFHELTRQTRSLSPFFLFLAAAVPLGAVTVTGHVELRDSQESSVRKKDYSGVVVWLEATGTTPAPPSVPGHARMVQKDKTFSPHVLPVTLGTTVDFPNFDPIFHNAFSNYNGQLFDVGLYPPGTSRNVRFSRPGVVRVFCNIHANMSAVIVVLNTPFFDKTRKDGSFELTSVPPGEYILHVFHERATQATLDGAARRITASAEPVLATSAVIISESGYLSIPHKNKFGHEYGAEPDEHGAYPSSKK